MSSTAAESDAELVEALRQSLWNALADSGEEKKLKESLRQQLVDCGWREQVKAHAKSIIAERGIDISVEELINAISAPASSAVPPEVRAELLLKLKTFLSAHALDQQLAEQQRQAQAN